VQLEHSVAFVAGLQNAALFWFLFEIGAALLRVRDLCTLFFPPKKEGGVGRAGDRA